MADSTNLDQTFKKQFNLVLYCLLMHACRNILVKYGTVDSCYLKILYFEISIPRHIRFAELRKTKFEQPHLTNIYM